MTIARKWILAAVIGGSVLGGAIGGIAFGQAAGSGNAKAATPSASSSSPNAARSGSFRPIEAKGHEANESTQREAQEDAGQVPTVP